MPPLQDKVVVITGASRGVGAAAARLFAQEGALVTLNARHKEGLEKVAGTLGVDESRYLVAPADIGKREGMSALVGAVMARFGRIDVFVNNAGLGVRKPITETSEDEWDLMFNVNVKGVFFSFVELVPIMRRQGSGHIINVSSLASKAGRATLGPYGASKGALNILTEGVGEELRNENIKVSLLMPGSIGTDFLSQVTEDRNPSAPDKPRMTPAQVAGMIVELARQDEGVWTSLVQMRPLRTK